MARAVASILGFVALSHFLSVSIAVTAAPADSPCDFLLSMLYGCVDSLAVHRSKPTTHGGPDLQKCCSRYALYTQTKCYCPSCATTSELLQSARRYGLDMLDGFCKGSDNASTQEAARPQQPNVTAHLLSIPLPSSDDKSIAVVMPEQGEHDILQDSQVDLSMEMAGQPEEVWTPEDVAAALDRSLNLAGSGGSAAAHTNDNGDITVEIEYNVAGMTMSGVAGNIKKVMNAVQQTLAEHPKALAVQKDGRQLTVDVSVELQNGKTGQQTKATRTLGPSDPWATVLSDTLKQQQPSDDSMPLIPSVPEPSQGAQQVPASKTLTAKAVTLINFAMPSLQLAPKVMPASGFEAIDKVVARQSSAAALQGKGEASSGLPEPVEFYDYTTTPESEDAGSALDVPPLTQSLNDNGATGTWILDAEAMAYDTAPGSGTASQTSGSLAEELLRDVHHNMLYLATPIARLFGHDALLQSQQSTSEQDDDIATAMEQGPPERPLRPPARKGLVVVPLQPNENGKVTGGVLSGDVEVSQTEEQIANSVDAAGAHVQSVDIDQATPSDPSAVLQWGTTHGSWLLEHYWDVLMLLSVINLAGVTFMAVRLWQLERTREANNNAAETSAQFMTIGPNTTVNPVAAIQRLLANHRRSDDLEAPLLTRQHGVSH